MTVSGGGGAITVRFAVPVFAESTEAALASTGYTAGVVPAGMVLVMVTLVAWPGVRATLATEKAVANPAGSVELRLNVLAAQPRLSLFVIESV